MKISIITVCYNSEPYIKVAIESVLFQSYADIEYIVIDGGSTDETLDLLNQYTDRITHIVSEPDKGIYDAMNKGIDLASGDIIGILNSDDFYPRSDVIANVVNAFKNNVDTDMVFGNVDFVAVNDLSKAVRVYSTQRFVPWKLRFGFMPPHPGAFIKKSVYDRVGQYKLGYKIAADFDMFIRMLLIHDFSFAIINQTSVRMRLGGISTAGLGSNLIATNEMVRALKENNIYSSGLLVSFRLPVKLFQLLLVKFGIK
ncbi:MAG: glycosyltransferase [Oceanospirillaceae bacterium]|nr:glycosyltransferase [Oceanospirillaceae bacterium]